MKAGATLIGSNIALGTYDGAKASGLVDKGLDWAKDTVGGLKDSYDEWKFSYDRRYLCPS